jgi:TRAP-type C4-dicarboxylate transport system permease small subunit
MTSKNIEPQWKLWLDRLLVIDVFLVLGGAVWFAVSVIADGQGFTAPMQQFQRLWDPLFTPAIGLLMAAALINGLWSWWQRRMQQAAQRNDS